MKNYFFKLKNVDETEIVINIEKIIYIQGEDNRGYYYIKFNNLLNIYISYDQYLELEYFLSKNNCSSEFKFVKLVMRGLQNIIVNVKFVDAIYTDIGVYLNSKTNKVFKERDYKLKIKGEKFNKWLTKESYYKLEKILLSDQEKGDKVNE